MKVLAGSGAGIARDFYLIAGGSAAGIVVYVGDLTMRGWQLFTCDHPASVALWY